MNKIKNLFVKITIGIAFMLFFGWWMLLMLAAMLEEAFGHNGIYVLAFIIIVPIAFITWKVTYLAITHAKNHSSLEETNYDYSDSINRYYEPRYDDYAPRGSARYF